MLRKIAVAFAAVLLLGVSVAAAQDRSVFWQRWDVTIDNVDTTNNQFNVTEIYDVQFSGTFRFGSAVIPSDNLEGINNVAVSEAGQPLQESCSEQAGTYCVSNSDSGLSVTYYFFHPITDATDHIELSYSVLGALRIYSGGDQLWWDAVPSDHYGFSIGSSTITVNLPQGYGPREGVDPVVTYGAPTNVTVNGTKVVAKTTGQISGDQNLEIRVQYLHDPNARVAAWQASYDQQAAFRDNVLPLLSIGVIGLSLLIGIGGVLGFYVLYLRRGRDPKVGPVPEYLSEPPSDLPPAIVGTLIDERADPRDAISTIIDLAHRGYLVIEETQNAGVFGFGSSSSFTFKRTDKPMDDLRDFERTMMNQLFGGSQMERSMDSLRYKFYAVISMIQNQLYQALVQEKLFTTNPNSTRTMWGAIGVVIFALAIVIGVVLSSFADQYSMVIFLIPGALAVVAVAALIVGPAMPAKTQHGAEEAAKWKAFYEYLRNLERYSSVDQAASQFERYLPYAVAFGLDRTWIHKFSQVQNVPIPIWYYPTYIGPYRRGYIAGSPLVGFGGAPGGGVPGGLASAGGGGLSLDKMSGNLAGGLENISTGLSHMLDSASSVMTSRPQSASSGSSGSWRSGGGHWSGGGGFSGGGHSGGGSRGFG